MSEQWLDVVGFEGLYKVSSLGRVKTLERFGKPEIILKPQSRKDGYLAVTLSRASVCRTHKIHVLTATAFLGPRPEGMDIRHLNGDRADNRVGNLAYGTRAQNEADKRADGSTHHNAAKTHCPRGHEYTPENTMTLKKSSGGFQRVCKTCNNERNREARSRRRV